MIWSMACREKFKRHPFHDGAQARHGRADADAGESFLRDGGVDDALGAVLLQQALAHLVRAVVLADLFSHEDDRVVALHLLVHGGAQGLAEGDEAHARTSS